MATIALINPNTSESTTARMVEIARDAGPGFRIVGLTAPFGAPLITDAAQLETGRRAVKTLLASLKDAAYRGIILSAFGDPGIFELRAGLEVPVVGIGECGMREAALEGRSFAVVTTSPGLVASIDGMAERLGLAAHYVGVELTAGDPVALTADAVRLEAALAEAIDRVIGGRRAEAVVIGGGPLAAAARALAPRFSVPIIEPIPAAVRALGHALAGGARIG
jgi:Asp/Glu/hydantoin racemase